MSKLPSPPTFSGPMQQYIEVDSLYASIYSSVIVSILVIFHLALPDDVTRLFRQVKSVKCK